MGFQVPESELKWSFGPSGGPGGQHANRSATRAELRWDVAGSPTLDEGTRRTLLERLPGLSNGVAVVASDSTRSQWRNRQDAKERLQGRVAEALRPRKTRRRTRIPKSAKARRRRAKDRRADLKKQRRRPELD